MIIRFERNGKIKYGWAVEDRVRVIEGNIFADGELTVMTGLEVPLRDVKLALPCIPTQVIVADDELTYPSQAVSGIIGPNDKIDFPHSFQDPHYGLAIGVVIKRDAKDIAAQDADDYIMGLTSVLSIHSLSQSRVESEFLYMVGPGIVPKLSLGDIKMNLKINNHTTNTQAWNTDIPKLLEKVTKTTRLMAGDMIIVGSTITDQLVHRRDKIEVETDGFLIPLKEEIL